MASCGRSKRELEEEIEDLRSRLAGAEDALRAIRTGEVDALVVPGAGGARVFTLEGAESAYRVLVEAMNEGAALLAPGGVLAYCNSRLAALLGIPLEAATGATLASFVAPPARAALDALLEQGWAGGCAGEIALLGLRGAFTPVQLSLSPLRLHGEARISLVATDLTERKRIEDQVRLLSTRDELTGLFNRRGFFELAEQQLKVARRARSELLLIFADLDGLKLINDTMGHSEGDRALVDAAGVLRQAFRESDIIARMGGDEFAVLATGSGPASWPTLSRRLAERVGALNRRGERPYALSMSWGCARLGAGDRLGLEELLQRADAAMYEEKRGHGEGRSPTPVSSLRAPRPAAGATPPQAGIACAK